jgi:hypothetical protein
MGSILAGMRSGRLELPAVPNHWECRWASPRSKTTLARARVKPTGESMRSKCASMSIEVIKPSPESSKCSMASRRARYYSKASAMKVAGQLLFREQERHQCQIW